MTYMSKTYMSNDIYVFGIHVKNIYVEGRRQERVEKIFL